MTRSLWRTICVAVVLGIMLGIALRLLPLGLSWMTALLMFIGLIVALAQQTLP